jgi:hypothetical protein
MPGIGRGDAPARAYFALDALRGHGYSPSIKPAL